MDDTQPATGGYRPSDLVEQMGDEGVAADIAQVYLQELPARVAALEAARGGLREDTVRVAHTLKSASALLGLTELSEVCREMEHTARDGGSVTGLVGAMTARAAEAEQAVRGWLASR
ncbi:Hpt domain-containing protein [Phycicoccus sp. DTK01]|uniref:Hpt domain-containing protein n=1 Tax=Phycicoccus sp. DTK01 TaxID=2785745 RepID=UPI001A8CEAAA|nr:Hpt domain-containing protein [Phycicoccus sp. DTK01]GIL34486.1 hypothetical protein PDTK01_05630 [Phycicoccus sp. DTK01]